MGPGPPFPSSGSSELPLVFISASHFDVEWRERLKAYLADHSGEFEWWDDSRILPGEKWAEKIDEAISRAAVAVLLISSNYVESDTTISECRQLVNRAQSGELWLLPIVVNECAWREALPALIPFQFWGMARPIAPLESLDHKVWGEIAMRILQIIRRHGPPSPSQSKEPFIEAAPPQPTLPKANSERSNYKFSGALQEILRRARSLGRESWHGRITTSSLLFGLAQSGDVSATGKFVHDALNAVPGRGRPRFDEVLESYVKERASDPDAGVVDDDLLANLSVNMGAVLEHSAELAVKVSKTSTPIQTRHLLASLLMAPDGERSLGVSRRFEAMGIEPENLRQQFREFIRMNVVGDDAEAWDEVLGTPSPGSWPLEETVYKLALSHDAAHFLRRLSQVGKWLNGPADTFAALVYYVLDADESPDSSPHGLTILKALRHDWSGRNSTEPSSVSGLLKIPEGKPELSAPVDIGDGIAGDLIEALKMVRWISRRISGENTLNDAVFLAVLLTKNPPCGYASLVELKNLGFNLDFIRAIYRRFLANMHRSHPQVIYDDLLGSIVEAIRLIGEDGQKQTDAEPYTASIAYFAPDRSKGDELQVGKYAEHLAQLIAAESTIMPLSIGLFGQWGSGKSHFMDLLEDSLIQLTLRTGTAFHKHIVQIRFNAWHYVDNSLWASLVCEIFDQLFKKLDESEDATAKQVANLKLELARHGSLAQEAGQALKAAEAARTEAEEELRVAMQKRIAEENTVRGMLDDLSSLVTGDERLKEELAKVAEGLGIPKLGTSFTELQARVAEVQTLGGRMRALTLSIFAGSGWWRRAPLLGVALLLPLAVAWLAEGGSPGLRDILSGAGRTIAQWVTAIGAVSAWISVQAKMANGVLQKMENAYAKVKEARERKEATDEAAAAQKSLSEKQQAEDQARHTLHEAEEKMKAIKAELSELAPGRLLIRFLKERAAAQDYRQHLGLTSLVRRDFEQLSSLLKSAKRSLPSDKTDVSQAGEPNQEPDRSLPQIDRIVLYIDDLDRCPSDRVKEVLEAVHLLLAFDLFAVIVAVDPRWLRQSLLDQYPRLLSGNGNGGIDAGQTAGRSVPQVQSASPQDYLEKIFQVPFNLQPMQKEGFDNLVKKLFVCGDASPEDSRNDVRKPESDDDIAKDRQSEQPKTDTIAQPKEGVPLPGPPLTSVGPTLGANPHPILPQSTPILPTSPAVKDEPQLVPEPNKENAGGALPPPDPQRLLLRPKEMEDVKRFLPFFATPRAVKRMSNTYALIRVGIRPEDWAAFIGSATTPGAYRLPMLLLAVASGFPGLAHAWLSWLEETLPQSWHLDVKQVSDLTERYRDTTEPADWLRLKKALAAVQLDARWPSPSLGRVQDWVPVVKRYSF